MSICCYATSAAPQSSTTTDFVGSNNPANSSSNTNSNEEEILNLLIANLPDSDGDSSQLLSLIQLINTNSNNNPDSSGFININNNPDSSGFINNSNNEDNISQSVASLPPGSSSGDLEQLIQLLQLNSASNNNTVQAVDDDQLTNAEVSIPNALFSVDYQVIFGQKKWS